MPDAPVGGAHARWPDLDRSGTTLSTLDLVREVAAASDSILPLLRGLCVEDVHVQRHADGGVPSSTSGDERYVHAWTSPARLAAALSVEEDGVATGRGRLAELLAALPPGTCVRLDPGTETGVVLGAVGGPVRCCAVTLDGFGGRTWPVYWADGPGRDVVQVVTAVERAVRRPVVVLVDGAPQWPAALLAPGQRIAVDVA